MSLTHPVANQENHVTSDGSISNLGQCRTRHGRLSGTRRARTRNWPRRRDGGASIGTIVLLHSVSDQSVSLSSLMSLAAGPSQKQGLCSGLAATVANHFFPLGDPGSLI